jgi:hypothetical protein
MGDTHVPLHFIEFIDSLFNQAITIFQNHLLLPFSQVEGLYRRFHPVSQQTHGRR